MAISEANTQSSPHNNKSVADHFRGLLVVSCFVSVINSLSDYK